MGFEKKSRPVCRAYTSAGQTIANNTWTPVIFDAETYDTDNMITPPIDHITIKRLSGYYHIIGQATFYSTSTAGTIRAMLIEAALGTPEAWDWRLPSGAWGLTALHANSIRYKAVNDVVHMEVYQDSGSSMTLASGWDRTFLAAYHVSGR